MAQEILLREGWNINKKPTQRLWRDEGLRRPPLEEAGAFDAGRAPGLKSYEPDELARARRRIKDLETELELVKAASALSIGGSTPKRGSARLFED